MIDINLTSPKPNSTIVKAAKLIRENPAYADRQSLAKKLDTTSGSAARILDHLKWADGDEIVACTRNGVTSTISKIRGNLKRADDTKVRMELENKLAKYEQRLRDLEAYRDAKRAGR